MNLMDYVRIFLRRWWIMALLVVLTMASAYVFSKMQTPVYRATQTILLQPSRMDYGLAEAATRVIRSYVVWLDSNDRAQEVVDALQLDMLPQELRTNATISQDESRLTITIDIDLPDGDLAATIARQWGALFEQWREAENQRARFEDQIAASLIDYPVPGQVRPDTTINVLAGAVLGLLLGAAIIFVLEYLESNIIRSRNDLARTLEIPVLGAIPPQDAR
ncbi:MAG: hypothetical protein JW910_16040 [Anaerolineae bacterium]|nr:hypothetical protein [Anaerolineae bacterium]